MRLFIAEKPSLAKKIAAALGEGKKGNGFIQGDDWCVTWCFGHLYEMLPPSGYNPEYKNWRAADLPIIPEKFLLAPKEEAKKQLAIIKELMKKTSMISSACDPDREGSKIGYDVITELGWKKPFSRLWLTDLTPKGIEKALNCMADASTDMGNVNSATARSQADWLVGMNLTRAATLSAREQGTDYLFSLGRVQTPTLNLIVTRDKLIENFKPVDFYSTQAEFKAATGSYPGTWIIPEEHLDPEGRCLDSSIPSAIALKIKGKKALIKSTVIKKKTEQAPLTFSLSGLQAYASEKCCLSVQVSLDTAQSLYDKGALTYPRTDCNYLEEGKISEVPAIMAALAGIDDAFSKAVKGADQSLKPRCFNDKKTTAHTAIIPTDKIPDFSKLTEIETKVYIAIAYRYIAQFFPPYISSNTEIVTLCEGESFKTSGNTPLKQGWKALLKPSKAEKEGDQDLSLPIVSDGENVMCSNAKKTEKKTKKPAHFTEGTLVTAMTNIARFVDNSAYKKYLRETDGLGTEATRAGIIEVLKERAFIEVKGKSLISTVPGRTLIDALPKDIKDPAMTALWEQALGEIATGKLAPEAFLKKQSAWLKKAVIDLKNMKIKSISKFYECPNCKKGKILKKRGEKGDYWSCNQYPDCTTTFPDKGGKPNTKAKKAAVVSTEHMCNVCSKGLIKRKGKKAGETFWSCSGFPECKTKFKNKLGKPVYNEDK